MEYVSYKEMIQVLKIKPGSTIFVVADIVDLVLACIENKEAFDADIFIDSIIDAVGCDGTVLFSTYNWGFCKGTTFNYLKTKGKTGDLGNVALKRSDFSRTQHPIYSFAVWGKDKDLLCNMTNVNAFGEGSIFAYLDKVKAINLVIGLECHHCYTFIHHVDDMSETKTWRYQKAFTAPYIDDKGIETLKTYTMSVRDLDLDGENIDIICDDFTQANISNRICINQIPFTIVDMHATYDVIMEDILHNRGRKICKYKGQDE